MAINLDKYKLKETTQSTPKVTYTQDPNNPNASIPTNTTQTTNLDKYKLGTTQTTQPTSLLDDLKGIGTGALKGLGSTAWGLGSLAENYIANPLQRAVGMEESDIVSNEKPEALVPQGFAENIGYGAEQIAEFLIPASKIAKLEKGISGTLGAIKGAKLGQLNKAGQITQSVLKSKLGGTIPTLAKAGVEAGYAGALTTAKEGQFNDNAKTAAIVGGLFPIAGGLLFNSVKALKPLGEKIQMSVLRPTLKDVSNGFKIGNVNKYNLGGGVGETLAKSSIKMNELGQKMANITKNSTDSINLNKTYKEVSDALLKTNKASQFGEIGATQRVLSNLKKEIEAVGGKNGLVDLVDATAVKRGAATKGAWAYGRFDPDSNATELVYDTFYNRLKTAIEKTSKGSQIKAINKELSEIIPIHTAALRRLPVEQRNNALSLTDSMGLYSILFDPKAMALVGVNKLSKSGTFGKFLVNVAERFKQPADPNLYRATSTGTQTLKGADIGALSQKLGEKMPIGNTIKDVSKGFSKAEVPQISKTFERAKGLTSQGRKIEDKAFKMIEEDEPGLIQKYNEMFGSKVVNTDNARKLFTSAGYVGKNAADVQEPSSYMAKKLFTKALQNPEKNVVFTAGGSGSGKTTAINRFLGKIEDNSAAVLDSNLSSYSSAVKKIKEAKDAGKIIKIAYVYREPVDSFVNGVVKRGVDNVSEMGRIVPIKTVADNHKGSLEVVKRLYREATPAEKNNFTFIDNSLGKDNIKKITFRELEQKSIPENINKQMKEQLDILYLQGKLGKTASENREAYIKYLQSSGLRDKVTTSQKGVATKSLNKIKSNIDNIAQSINENGGITYNASKGNLGGKEAYSIAMYPERSKTFQGEITKKDILQYISDNIDLLGKKGHSLGGWYDTEAKQLWLDVAGTVKDKNTAIKLGKKFNQKAIFDLSKFEEIPTGGTGESVKGLPDINNRMKLLEKLSGYNKKPILKKIEGEHPNIFHRGSITSIKDSFKNGEAIFVTESIKNAKGYAKQSYNKGKGLVSSVAYPYSPKIKQVYAYEVSKELKKLNPELIGTKKFEDAMEAMDYANTDALALQELGMKFTKEMAQAIRSMGLDGIYTKGTKGMREYVLTPPVKK